MSITSLLAISLGAILTNNFIFAQFLGICPFLGVSKKSDTAIGMGLAVTFVMGIASAVCFGVNKLLIALDLGYMQTVAFILVIAGLVQFIEMFLKKAMPSLYTALGVYLPLITTNCAVLGVVLLNVQNDYTFIASATGEQTIVVTDKAGMNIYLNVLSSSPWYTASPAASASCWRSTCSPPSVSACSSPTIPSALKASPSR